MSWIGSRPRLACVASSAAAARAAQADLAARYDLVDPDDCEVIVALGGDGLLLHTIHEHLHLGRPIFAMNRGTVVTMDGTNLAASSRLHEFVREAVPPRYGRRRHQLRRVTQIAQLAFSRERRHNSFLPLDPPHSHSRPRGTPVVQPHHLHRGR